jgi:Ni,Fe-hydrogenase III large subunit
LLRIFHTSASFLDRVEQTGVIYAKTAKDLELTGPPLRAAGVAYDVRKAFPYELYEQVKFSATVAEGGGVYERLHVKAQEIRNAVAIIGQLQEHVLSKAPLQVALPSLKAGQEGHVLLETVKGELLVYAVMGDGDKFDRVYLRTPSFNNWAGLTYVVIGEIVPDFPLCNKSFNLSYAENDR